MIVAVLLSRQLIVSVTLLLFIMEVIVRNLPDQITEKQVNTYFRNVLDKHTIKTYHIQKLRNRGWATIAILDVGKARQFLNAHGQTEPGTKGFRSVRQKLYHMGRPINCSQSNKLPDKFLLMALKKEESDRYAAAQSRKPVIVPGKGFKSPIVKDFGRAFNIIDLNCGQWSYVRSDLVFATYSRDARAGRIIFGDRALMIKLWQNTQDLTLHQIEIPYSSVQSFTLGPKSKPTMTLSLSEAPKFYESLSKKTADSNGDNLTDMLQNMTVRRSSQMFTRKRISALSPLHETVVASCLCYRVLLLDPEDLKGVQALKGLPAIPGSITLRTSTKKPEPFTAQMTRLNTALAGVYYGNLPFEVKFQMQKLAQNGYLSPSRVTELLAVVARHFENRPEARVVATSIRNLSAQLPFVGPDTEASDLSLVTLSEILLENQGSILRGESYSLAERHDHITDVHKAMVTPAGIYLYGPEPEIRNRVLRKYSQFPNHFLSVSFMDEDGESLRFDRQTSGEDIYRDRFKKILEGVINIAGRGYEVRIAYALPCGSLIFTLGEVLRIFSFFPPNSNMLVHGTFYDQQHLDLRKICD